MEGKSLHPTSLASTPTTKTVAGYSRFHTERLLSSRIVILIYKVSKYFYFSIFFSKTWIGSLNKTCYLVTNILHSANADTNTFRAQVITTFCDLKFFLGVWNVPVSKMFASLFFGALGSAERKQLITRSNHYWNHGRQNKLHKLFNFVFPFFHELSFRRLSLAFCFCIWKKMINFVGLLF